MSNTIKGIIHQRNRLIELNENCRNQISGITSATGQALSLQEEIADPDFSIADIHSRIDLLIDYLTPITNINRSTLFALPNLKFTHVEQTCVALADQLQSLSERVSSLGQATYQANTPTRTISNLDGNATVNLEHEYKTLNQNVELALAAAIDARTILSIKNVPTLGKATKRLSETISQLGGITSESRTLERATRKSASDAQKLLSQATTYIADIQEAIETAQAHRDAVGQTSEAIDRIHTETQRKSEELLQRISEINANADNVRTRVEEFNSQFIRFEEALEKRERSMREGSTTMEELIENLSDQSVEAGDLIEKSKEALDWTTVEGLTLSFSKSAEQLDPALKNATRAVYWS